MNFNEVVAKVNRSDGVLFYDFTSESEAVVLDGFSKFESWGCWTDGFEASMTIKKEMLNGYCSTLLIVLHGYYPDDCSYIDFNLKINGCRLRSFRVTKRYIASKLVNYSVVVVDLFESDLTDDISLHFSIFNPSSPAEHGRSGDPRKLGLGFETLWIGDTLRDLSELDALSSVKFNLVDYMFDSRVPVIAYSFAQVVNDLLNEEGVKAFFSWGSLLGAFRHKGIIPWDDDLDMCLPIEYESLFVQRCIPRLVDIGFDVVVGRSSGNEWQGYQVKSRLHNYYDFIPPYIDIFIIDRNEGGDYFFPGGFTSVYYLEKEVFPLKTKGFGPAVINVPNNSDAILAKHYGANYLSDVKKYNHNYKTFIK